MLIPIPPLFRPRRRPRKVTPAPPPPPVALTLRAATFVLGPPRLTLTFDRPINLAGFVPGQVTVRVGATELQYQGAGATLASPAVALVTLVAAGFSGGGGVRLTATADTEIVASDDGGTWAGVTNLILPFL